MEGLAEGDEDRVEILGRQIETPIDRIVPAGDPASRTFSVQMVLDNPEGSIKSGMFARVYFTRGERQMLRVETEAVVTRGQLTGIFVVGDEGKARLRWIKIGRADTDADGVERVEVLSGLKPGERYVLSPSPGLVDGALVEVTP